MSISIIEYQKMFRSTLKAEVVFAGQMLEARGMRLGVEFGTSNAIQKATEVILESLEEMDKWDRFGYGV
jgi:hypothetical protein